MTSNNAAPGWYPVDDRTERYWNGNAWADQTRPRNAAGDPTRPRTEPTQPLTPQSSSAGAGPYAGAPGGAVPGSGGNANPGRAPGALTPSSSKPAWYRRGWVIGIAALLLGIVLGSAAASGGTDPKTTDEYKQVSGDLKDTKSDLATANSDLAAAQADLKDIAGELPAREAKLKKDLKALEARKAAVTKAEAGITADRAAVKKREKKVGIVEKDIEANTIPGDGIYEVGKDMKAGTYRSTAPDSGNCYHAVNSDANGNNIESNNNTAGPSVVTVTNGKFFETNGCSEWVLTR